MLYYVVNTIRFCVMVEGIGFSDILSVTQPIGIVGTMIMTPALATIY
jgi:hypothetical protein